jgi:hypothetical protein
MHGARALQPRSSDARAVMPRDRPEPGARVRHPPVAARRVPERTGFTRLSRHARVRVRQRARLSDAQVLRLIERGLCVRTGIAPASNREHPAFDSQPDDAVFVAIHDDLRGRLVTVLPLAYHRQLAWEVSMADQARAKALVPGAEPAPQATAATAGARFVVSVTDRAADRFKTAVLCKTPQA